MGGYIMRSVKELKVGYYGRKFRVSFGPYPNREYRISRVSSILTDLDDREYCWVSWDNNGVFSTGGLKLLDI